MKRKDNIHNQIFDSNGPGTRQTGWPWTQADLPPPITMQSEVGTHSDHHTVGQGRESFWAPSASWKPVNLSQQSQCTARLPEPRGQSTSRGHPTQFWSKMWVKIMFHCCCHMSLLSSYTPSRVGTNSNETEVRRLFLPLIMNGKIEISWKVGRETSNRKQSQKSTHSKHTHA